jgi:hypothetical protein
MSRACIAVRGNLQAYSWTLVFAAALAGCTSGESAPVPGKVNLELSGISDSEVSATLSNGLDRPVRIRGNRTLSWAVRMSSINAPFGCGGGAYSGIWQTEGFGYFNEKLSSIEVSPGEKKSLVVPTTLPKKYKGGRCTLAVKLEDGTVVGPVEFRP